VRAAAPAAPRPRPAEAALVAAAVAVFAVLAGAFAAHQAIWVDETTQLSGLTLPPGQQFAWLAGRIDPGFGVPPDRMPPLGYVAGTLWAMLFGLGEAQMRWLGIVLVAAAAPALYLSGRRAGGVAGGVLVLALVLLSGNVIVNAVEIRAYALFFCLAAWAVHFLVAIVLSDEPALERHRILLMAVFLLLAVHTHFFGVVAACCLFAALLADRLLRRRSLRMVWIGAAYVAVAGLGILPFVQAAVAVSADATAAGGGAAEAARGMARLVWRLVVHPVQLAATPAMLVYLGALGVLAVLLALRILGRDAGGAGDGSRRAALVLVLPVVLAVAGLGASSLVVRGFDVLAPHYNIWLLPLPAIVLAMALRPGRGGRFARVAAAVAVIGLIPGAATLLRTPALYSHGPGEWLAAQLGEVPEATILIHDAGGVWGQAYFPVHFLTGGRAEQWLDEGGRLSRIRPGGLDPLGDTAAARAAAAAVLRVRAANLDGAALARLARGAADCADLAPPGGAGARHFCAFVAATVTPE
jgi:hypothetical protein